MPRSKPVGGCSSRGRLGSKRGLTKTEVEGKRGRRERERERESSTLSNVKRRGDVPWCNGVVVASNGNSLICLARMLLFDRHRSVRYFKRDGRSVVLKSGGSYSLQSTQSKDTRSQ
jgi:hypothetical protein